MLDTIYCCRFGQRDRRAVFVVLSAAASRILQFRCTTADGRNVSDPTVFWHDGDWRCEPSLASAGTGTASTSLNAYPRAPASPLPVGPPRRRREVFRSSRLHPATTTLPTC